MSDNVTGLPADRTRPLAVIVYRRIEPPTARMATSIIGHLNELEAAGIIDEVVDIPVPARVDATGEDPRADHGVASLNSLANETDVSLSPACRTIERSNKLTGDRETITVYPIVTLVVKDATDGSILAVAPSQTDTGHLPVPQLLDELENTDQ